MKHFIAFCLLWTLMPMAAEAVEDRQVMYAGGTAVGLREGTIGRLDTTSPDSLTFEGAGTTVAIPYKKIDSYEYTRPVARHLGVLPAIAVGLVKKRQHRHYFQISYHDETGEARVAVFEVPKQMPPVLLAILQTKVPGTCKAATMYDQYCSATR